MYGTSRCSINSHTDLNRMHIQCSNLNPPRGFLWCGPIWCLHYIIPAVQIKHTFFLKMFFFSMYPIVDTGLVNYDFFFFLFFLECSSNAVTEMKFSFSEI